MTISIRPIKASDKIRWLELFKEYIVFYKSKLSDEQFELTWQRLNSGFNINGLLAELDGEIVGFTHYIFRPSCWSTVASMTMGLVRLCGSDNCNNCPVNFCQPQSR